MTPLRVIISLPTKDLRRAFEFYRGAVGLRLTARTEGDRMPEPVEFLLDGNTRLMLVPADGFQWVIGENSVAENGVSETVLGVGVRTKAEVDELFEKVCAAGAGVTTAPGQKPWGYSASFRDLDGHVWMIVAEDAALEGTEPSSSGT
jgi:predicted lactoylglutathione lyase